MKRLIQTGLATLLAGIVIVGLAGAWAAGAARDKREVDRMTEKMKTVCVGRALVDMPEEAEVELTHPRIEGFDIVTFSESNEEFHSRLSQREAYIRSVPDRLGGNKNLEVAREIKTDHGVAGRFFVHGRTVTEGQSSDGITVERYRYEAVAVEALVHVDGISIDISANQYGVDAVEALPQLVAQLIPNPANKIPTEPGFCIDRAYFRDPLSAAQGEEVRLMARLPNHPDIEFMLISAAGVKPEEQGLLERNAESRAGMSAAEKMHVSTIRAAVRTISGLKGDEVIERFVEDNAATVYSFWWEVGGTEDNVFIPHISFTMDTGKGEHGPTPSSLSEGVALGLWDKISSSFRIRPTVAPKLAVTEPLAVPIGTQTLAGESCPHSGWWLCSEPGGGMSVLGGQRQYLCKGQKMPQALLLPPQTLWQRMRGLQSSYEVDTRTAWKLVDKRERDRGVPRLPLAQATLAAQASGSQLSGKVLSGTGPGVAIGCISKTGMQCPASGWWRCEESHALDGTRWFAVGSLLPAATFEIPSAAFGRTFGRAQAIQRRSVWQLVRHAGAPGTGATSSPDDEQPPVVA
ncbi:T6SS immunity protein Tli4 family protein [Massilia sp.]|uniref:T6SS immunity protein Tli4 family protein n=1 Tax=Massilia sp. TaxID=1882437 RepID=UPI0028AA9F3B|nr:T6SS immunity protein Tli4 family protein [Massilia sp.]